MTLLQPNLVTCNWTAQIRLDLQSLPPRLALVHRSFKVYIYIDKVNLGTEISTTKQSSENVAQPGIEPGSPDYRSDALTTQPLNQPHWEHILLYNTYTVFGLEMVRSEETISHILCNQDHVTTPRSIGDARPYPPGN